MRVTTIVFILAIIGGLGYYLYRSGTLAKMEKETENSFDYHYSKGQTLFQAGNYEDAIKEMQRAAELDPKNADAATAMMRVGDCYKQLGKKKEALDAYEKTVSAYPDSKIRPKLDKSIAEMKGGM